jgi:rhodanese-related sulfurtransferase
LSCNYTNATAAEAKRMVDNDPELIILDVRTRAEYSKRRLRNAKLVPVGELTARLNQLSKFDTILVYCRLGVRSARASGILVRNGFQDVYNMLGGITAWIDAGYPVCLGQSSKKRTLPYVHWLIRKMLNMNKDETSTATLRTHPMRAPGISWANYFKRCCRRYL